MTEETPLLAKEYLNMENLPVPTKKGLKRVFSVENNLMDSSYFNHE